MLWEIIPTHDGSGTALVEMADDGTPGNVVALNPSKLWGPRLVDAANLGERQRLLEEASCFLVKKMEVERRWLVRWRNGPPKHVEIQNIVQYYLQCLPPSVRRIRQVEAVNATSHYYTYFYTEKGPEVAPHARPESECAISPEAFREWLTSRDLNLAPIRKTRTVIKLNNLKFEIDSFFDEPRLLLLEGCMILEVEDVEMDAVIVFPDCLEVVREVTGLRAFSNFAFAQELGRLELGE